MEDRYSLQPYFQPEPPQTPGDSESAAEVLPAERVPTPLRAVLEGRANCAYCGVFDGHSAAAAADVASLRMHRVLAQELGSLAQCVVPCPRLAIQMKFFVRSSGTAVLPRLLTCWLGCEGLQVASRIGYRPTAVWPDKLTALRLS